APGDPDPLSIPVNERAQISDGRLWVGLLAAPLAWATQLLLGWGSEELACTGERASTTVAGLELGHFVVVVSFAAATVALGGLVVAVTSRLSVRDDALGRVSFMAAAGILVSAVFLGAIVLAGSAALVLDPCEAG
ncbi:MAG TPA: hypothetical protein VFT33_06105, partial [Gaiellaceae bacterium]|nr:hypothetical protein [Gaiellaceae bacterium]